MIPRLTTLSATEATAWRALLDAHLVLARIAPDDSRVDYHRTAVSFAEKRWRRAMGDLDRENSWPVESEAA